MDEQNPRVGANRAAEQRTREIRAEIDQTRDDLSETVNAIQDKLRPSSIASNAAETVKQAAVSKAREVANSEPVNYVSANPIPMTMVGIGIAGLAWLATAGRQPRSGAYARRRFYASDNRTGVGYDRERRYVDENDMTSTPRPSYSSTDRNPQLRNTPDDWRTGYETDYEYDAYGRRGYSAGWMQHRAEYAQSYLRRAWQQSPLMCGAASAVVGAVVALGIPETERENQLMGETRDSMIDSVQETVREKVDQVQEAATKAVSTVQETAQSALGLQSSEENQTREPRGNIDSRA